MDQSSPVPSVARPRKRKRDPSALQRTTEKQSRRGNMAVRSLGDYQDNLLSTLECQVCTEIMKSPILQCSSGHSFCSNCIKRVSHCPVCKTSVSNPVRNFSLEKMSEQVPIPCPNKKHGCQERMFGSKDPHGNRCPYRECKCPISPGMYLCCWWRGQHSHIPQHVTNAHPLSILRGNNFTNMFALTKSYQLEVSLLQLQKHLFVCCSKHSHVQEKISLAVKYLGPSDIASKFAYRIIFVLPDKSMKITFIRKVHSEDENIQTLLDTEDCFTITEQQIKLFKVPNQEYKYYNDCTIIRM